MTEDVSRETRKVFDTLSVSHQKVLTNIVFRGMCQTKAYMDAYPDSSEESARRAASELLTNHDMQQARAELKQEVADKASVDAQWAMSKLVELVDIGMYKPTSEEIKGAPDGLANKLGTDINAVKGVINEINKMQGNHAAEKKDITSKGESIAGLSNNQIDDRLKVLMDADSTKS